MGEQRRLAAVVSADVVGYSRLMGADEDGTLSALRAHRAELWNPTIERHDGRVVGTAGDSLLIEFSSAVAAVEAALAVQRGMAKRNAGLPEHRRMHLRIGINIGEVVAVDGDIFGDGVNIAARLQEVAAPCGIAISDNVHEQVCGKLDVAFADHGPQTVKNIARPVRIWHWPAGGAGREAEPRAAPVPQLSVKPAIAVLPFDNLSGDPEQEYFADGIAEDIIGALSRFRDFAVIARNSSFAFKGTANDIRDIARELGARYLLEGSVRKAGNRVRVAAQLIDGEDASHLWSERFDSELHDVFALQDELSVAIVSAVAPRSVEAASRRLGRLDEAQLGSWDLLLQARASIARYDREGFARARTLLERAIARDPANGQAHAWLTHVLVTGAGFGWVGDIAEARRQAAVAARAAVSLDPDDAFAHCWYGAWVGLGEGDLDRALAEFELAVRLNSNLATAHGGLCSLSALRGDLDTARKQLAAALTLSPRDPLKVNWLIMLNIGEFVAGNYEQVVERASDVLRERPDHPGPWRQRAAALAMLDRLEEARADIERLLELVPGNSLPQVREQLPWFPDLERFLEGLRRAGLPEG